MQVGIPSQVMKRQSSQKGILKRLPLKSFIPEEFNSVENINSVSINNNNNSSQLASKKIANHRDIHITREMQKQLLLKFENFGYFESQQHEFLYFREINVKSLMNAIPFDKNAQSIDDSHSDYRRCVLIVSKIFSEIFINDSALLICKAKSQKKFYVYFLGIDTCPFSKCCDCPIILQFDGYGQGSINCGNPKCIRKNLQNFLIYYQQNEIDEKQFFINKYKQQDYISKMIRTGEYKKVSLKQQCSKLSDDFNQTILEQNKNDFKSLQDLEIHYIYQSNYIPKIDRKIRIQSCKNETLSAFMKKIDSKSSLTRPHSQLNIELQSKSRLNQIQSATNLNNMDKHQSAGKYLRIEQNKRINYL